MRLTTMEPNPEWDESGVADAVAVISGLADDLSFKVWGGDWCPDCRNQLPDFAAALDAAGVPEAAIEHCPVEKAEDGSKIGPLVDEYGIAFIPTVVVERDGEEVARFVEEESVPIVVFLAEQLRELETPV